MAFKMKGSPMQRNFGIGSPMKQDKKGKVTPGEKVKPKFRLAVGTKPDGTKDYFKIDEKGKQIKISKVEHDSLKGN